MSTCELCGNEFDYNSSPAHTVCASCYDTQMRSMYDEEVFIDPLGIVWTEAEMKEAGGKEEILKLIAQARDRF